MKAKSKSKKGQRPSPVGRAASGSPLRGETLFLLEDGRWVESINRCRTREGLIRLYKRICRETPQGAPYGMMIATVHARHLGRFIGSEWQTGNDEALPQPGADN